MGGAAGRAATVLPYAARGGSVRASLEGSTNHCSLPYTLAPCATILPIRPGDGNPPTKPYCGNDLQRGPPGPRHAESRLAHRMHICFFGRRDQGRPRGRRRRDPSGPVSDPPHTTSSHPFDSRPRRGHRVPATRWPFLCAVVDLNACRIARAPRIGYLAAGFVVGFTATFAPSGRAASASRRSASATAAMSPAARVTTSDTVLPSSGERTR
ncbi:hypothetical protein KOR34_17940 [Posidoniimonas corsicana]|uniref:Uncharacterized protein n=1 Tax=Posidoniimonas corsicana TaxID=1938618 RepID=A0A5C5VG16_9BACT|nr:hypothetical protein KOR34_17940 [Posidoniimonas corsicana]